MKKFRLFIHLLFASGLSFKIFFYYNMYTKIADLVGTGMLIAGFAIAILSCLTIIGFWVGFWVGWSERSA